MGPTVAWFQTSPRAAIAGFVGTFLGLALIFSFISLGQGGAFGDWVMYWQLWVIVVVGCFLMASPFKIDRQAAGADWFAWTHFRIYFWWHRPRWKYIYIYEITRITAHVYGATGIFLRFRDLRGNELEKKRHELQLDQAVWDYLYNGIIHSLAQGAQMDKLSLQVLEISDAVKFEKVKNWRDRKPLPNWPEDLEIPDRDSYNLNF